jgi:hypothetical protein
MNILLGSRAQKNKSRINFLKLLRCEYADFVINDQALSYMAGQKLPGSKFTSKAANF